MKVPLFQNLPEKRKNRLWIKLDWYLQENIEYLKLNSEKFLRQWRWDCLQIHLQEVEGEKTSKQIYETLKSFSGGNTFKSYLKEREKHYWKSMLRNDLGGNEENPISS